MHSPSEPSLVVEFDELDHQALDLLDGIDCGEMWLSARRRADPTELERTLDSLGESPERVANAVTRVRPLLIGLVGRVADSVVNAAARLARTEDRGRLDEAALAGLHEQLAKQPESGAGIEWAARLTLEILGLERNSIAWALVESLPQEVPANDHTQVIEAIGERLELARAGTPSTPLRVFRTAALNLAGPSLRATTLATEHPEAIALALQIVQAKADAQQMVEQFDLALAATQGQGPAGEPLANIDGPKRKFTIVHVILAAIVLGLTLWHYIWR